MDADSELRERLKRIEKEFEKKQRKLQKFNRKTKAKAHVKKKLKEQALLCESEAGRSGRKLEKKDTAKTCLSTAKSIPHDLKHLKECQNDKKIHVDTGHESVLQSFSNHEFVSRKEIHNISNEQPHQSKEERINIGLESEQSHESTVLDSKVTQELSNSPCSLDELQNNSDNANRNKYSQDIFSSPKTPERNIFEDIHKTVGGNNGSEIEKIAEISSGSGQNCFEKISSSETNLKTKTIMHAKENIEPTLHCTEKYCLKSSSCSKSCKTEKRNDSFNNTNLINLKSKEKTKSIVHKTHKHDLQCHFPEKIESIGKLDKSFDKAKSSELDDPKETLPASSTVKANPGVSSTTSKNDNNNKGLNGRKPFGFSPLDAHISVIQGESPDESMLSNNNVVVNSKQDIDSTESFSSMSESTKDSDWKEPYTSEDIVKSRRRRRSTITPKRRHSLRVAELSSQESMSQSFSGYSSIDNEIPVRKFKRTSKKLIVSSIFQCLIDEGKRDASDSEFSLPLDIIEDISLRNSDSEKESAKLKDTERNCFLSPDKDSIDDENQEYLKITNSPTKLNVLSNVDPSISKSVGTFKSTSSSGLTKKYSENMVLGKALQPTEGISEPIPSKSQTENALSRCSSISTETRTTLGDATHDKQYPNSVITCASNQSSVCTNDSVPVAQQSSEQYLSMSPPLFESQTDSPVLDSQSPELFARETNIGCRASPAGVAVVPEDSESLDGYERIVLEQKATFQIPKHDQLVAMVTGEVLKKLFIVCLCATGLKFYQQQDDHWSCFQTDKLDTLVKKNSCCGITWIAEKSGICVLLQQRKTDCVKLVLYTGDDVGVKKMVLDSLWSRSVLVCDVKEGEFIASHLSNEKSHLTKYTTTHSPDNNRQNFEPISDQLSSLCKVKDNEEAILGLSTTGQLYIWNSSQMSLLTTVGVGDVCPPESICSYAFAEQGFLFLPVFSRRRCKQAGSILVVNPQMGTSETLAPLEARNNKWTGCSSSVMLQDNYILVRETSGAVLIWDVYTGELVTAVNDVNVSCVSSTASALIIGHKQCIHVYHTVLM